MLPFLFPVCLFAQCAIIVPLPFVGSVPGAERTGKLITTLVSCFGTSWAGTIVPTRHL